MFALDAAAQAKATALIAALAEKFPAAFQIDENRRRPLRIGIGGDLMDDNQIAAALTAYATSPGYLRACQPGAIRINLDGLPAGEVTEPQANFARRQLEGRSEEKLANGRDKKARNHRATLADLRALARARREGGAS